MKKGEPMEHRRDHSGRRLVMLNSRNEPVDDSARSTGCVMHPDDKPVHRGKKQKAVKK